MQKIICIKNIQIYKCKNKCTALASQIGFTNAYWKVEDCSNNCIQCISTTLKEKSQLKIIKKRMHPLRKHLSEVGNIARVWSNVCAMRACRKLFPPPLPSHVQIEPDTILSSRGSFQVYLLQTNREIKQFERLHKKYVGKITQLFCAMFVQMFIVQIL